MTMPSDDELLRRAVTGVRPKRGAPRWSAVSDLFLLGSTYSQMLCMRFDLNPDEKVRP